MKKDLLYRPDEDIYLLNKKVSKVDEYEMILYVYEIGKESLNNHTLDLLSTSLKYLCDTRGLENPFNLMMREDLTTTDWIDHAIEEALDLACYLTRLKLSLTSSPQTALPSPQ